MMHTIILIFLGLNIVLLILIGLRQYHLYMKYKELQTDYDTLVARYELFVMQLNAHMNITPGEESCQTTKNYLH
jgi:hypothetical protein